MRDGVKGFTLKVIIHIGWRRTGTTSIQRFLRENREPLLARGIHYPEAGLHFNGHHVAAWLLWSPPPKRMPGKDAGGASAESVFAQMFDEGARRGAGTMIVSSEELSSIDRYEPARLARLLSSHETRVIAYVRRQDAYLESLFSYRVQSSRTRYRKTLSTFVADHLRGDALDYHAHFRRWADLFGTENVAVRRYDRGLFVGGDVRRDFCDFVGIDPAGLAFARGDNNASLDADSIRFLSRLNAVPLSVSQHGQVVDALRNVAGRASTARANGLLAPRERALVVEKYAASNERFAREFLGATAFDATSEGEPGPALSPPDDDSFIDTLATIMPGLLSRPDARPRRQRD